MIDFNSFFKNHFDTKNVSNDNLIKFGDANLYRMIANNPGDIYTPLITATTAAVNNFKGAVQAEDQSKSLKEGATVNVDKYQQQYIDLVSLKEGIISGTWGKDAAEYQHFIPHGLDEYHQATRSTIETLMARFNKAGDDHKSALPGGFIDPFKAITVNYIAARTLQLTLMGAAEGQKFSAANFRTALEIQLMTNVLTIALNNIGNLDVMSIYFDQSIIRKPAKKKEEGGEEADKPLAGTVEASKSAVVMHGGFDANTEFSLTNPGTTPLKFYTANMPGDPVPGATTDLQPGEQVETWASEMGGENNLFLMVYNPDTSTAGSYEVRIVEE
jgi:hypothetical protein